MEAAEAMKRGVQSVLPTATVVCLPVADGGEGTADALVSALHGTRRRVLAHDPLGNMIEAEYGILPDGTAVIDTAAASGLALLKKEKGAALHASSYGTGELLADAIQNGAKKVILGLGGSATTDGGAGLAQRGTNDTVHESEAQHTTSYRHSGRWTRTERISAMEGLHLQI